MGNEIFSCNTCSKWSLTPDTCCGEEMLGYGLSTLVDILNHYEVVIETLEEETK
jgi:hypothetical protein